MGHLLLLQAQKNQVWICHYGTRLGQSSVEVNVTTPGVRGYIEA